MTLLMTQREGRERNVDRESNRREWSEIEGGDGGDAEMGHNGALRLHLQHMFRDKIKNNSSSITNPKTIV
jgi:hypothetical protein